MIITIDTTNPTPPYEQLRAQVEGLAARGALPVGSRLPTVRALARDLGLAPGTVARAYRELEREGRVETRGRHGTFVAATSELTSKAREQELAQAAQEFVQRVQALAIPRSRAVSAIEAALRGPRVSTTDGHS